MFSHIKDWQVMKIFCFHFEQNLLWYTAQRMKFSIKDFFNKWNQIRSKLRIWSHLLTKSFMENVIFVHRKACRKVLVYISCIKHYMFFKSSLIFLVINEYNIKPVMICCFSHSSTSKQFIGCLGAFIAISFSYVF